MNEGKEAYPKRHASKNTIGVKAHKSQSSIIHEKIASEIQDRCWKSGSGIVSFKDARSIASHYIRLKRAEMYLFFEEMKQLGLIEIVPYHGIRVSKEVLA